MTPDGLLFASARADDIALTLATLWEAPAQGDRVDFFIKKSGQSIPTLLHEEKFDGTGDVPTVPINFDLPADEHDPEGSYELTYVVDYAGGGSENSIVTPLTTDYTAPGGGRWWPTRTAGIRQCGRDRDQRHPTSRLSRSRRWQCPLPLDGSV